MNHHSMPQSTSFILDKINHPTAPNFLEATHFTTHCRYNELMYNMYNLFSTFPKTALEITTPYSITLVTWKNNTYAKYIVNVFVEAERKSENEFIVEFQRRTGDHYIAHVMYEHLKQLFDGNGEVVNDACEIIKSEQEQEFMLEENTASDQDAALLSLNTIMEIFASKYGDVRAQAAQLLYNVVANSTFVVIHYIMKNRKFIDIFLSMESSEWDSYPEVIHVVASILYLYSKHEIDNTVDTSCSKEYTMGSDLLQKIKEWYTTSNSVALLEFQYPMSVVSKLIKLR